jgi:hypothetical protein
MFRFPLNLGLQTEAFINGRVVLQGKIAWENCMTKTPG